MLFDRIRRAAGVTGLVAAVAVAMPVLPAAAATPGEPTAATIMPDVASRTAAARTSDASLSGGIVVAQNERKVRRQQRNVRRERARVRDARRDLRSDRRDLRRDRRDLRRDRRDYRRDVRRWDRRHYYNGRWYYSRDNNWYDDSGAVVAAGVIGLAAGAIAGSALANSGGYGGDTIVVTGSPAPYSAEWYRQCDLKYNSFRSSDGTYLGYDGYRHVCRLP